MTDATHNYSDLLELAVLDAHGLLEPIESELFNRSFHEAPASIQDEIIRMQLEFATDVSLLPADLPTAELRKIVLLAVANAADKEASHLAPLALIGARVSATKSNFGTAGSSALWRTVAMILFGVTVVLAIITLDAQRTAKDFSQRVAALQSVNSIKEDGKPGMAEALANPLSRVVRLEREEGNNNGYIRVSFFSNLKDPKNPNKDLSEYVLGEAFGYDLEDGAEVIIQGTTKSGEVIELARINASNSSVLQKIEISKDQLQGLTIAGVDAKTGARWI